jgi:hypothetical protein
VTDELAAFTAFFNGEFDRALRGVVIPGMETASWDRRAAYLLWQATNRGAQFAPVSSPEPQPSRSVFD